MFPPVSAGGNEWHKIKSRAQESVNMAEGLIKLYASRQAIPGYAFS